MTTFFLILACVTLVAYLVTAIEITLGNRSISRLENISPMQDQQPPMLSIIIPGRNEERGIEGALRSVLRQDYPNFEVLVINDRSTDATGEILARMANESERLRVIHVRELPPGWLGKNHALHLGAAHASGTLLLFTDADVVMHPSVLRRAAGYMLERKLDHLAIAPRAIMPGTLLSAFTLAFTHYFALYAKPWKASDPKSRRHIGLGAFNMVRAAVYRAIGGHKLIAMRPDDDMKLGKLIKKNGYRQEIVFGASMITVEWYTSLRELIAGLMKNMFSGLDYSVTAVIAVSTAQLLLDVWPFVAVLVTRGVIQLLNGLIVLTICAVLWPNARSLRLSRWLCLAFPLTTVLFVYILLKSTWITFANDGIEWGGTHYSLAQLRANKV